MADYFLGLDQGTTNTKAVLIDQDGRIVSVAERRLGISSPQPGWIEQDPEEMVANAIACMREVARPGIAAIGVCNQTETLIVWDEKSGAPLVPAMGWQCRRSAGDADAMRPHADAIARTAGLDLDPSFTATKLRWLFRERPDIAARLRDGSALWGTVDTWLLWKLTGGAAYATDAGNASRTMLFDIDTCDWSLPLESLFGLALPRKAEAGDSARHFGTLARGILGAEIPVTAVMGDQQASLYGHGCIAPGSLKASFGTGAFVWLNTGAKPRLENRKGCLATIAWKLGEPVYALEGFVMYAGAIVEWLLKTLGLGDDPARVEALARQVDDSGGVSLVPAFQGLGSPWWDSETRAALTGLSAATTPAHICRAGLEAIAFQTRAVLEAMGGDLEAISVDGGATRSALLMEILASSLDIPVRKAAHEHLAGYGVALMAGRARSSPSSSSHELDTLPVEGRDQLNASYERWLRTISAMRAK
jgi:glycerol kinase